MAAGLVFKELLQGHFDPEQVRWQPFRPGVEIARLYGGADNEASAALLRYAPNAAVPRHVHHGFEHILVLSGSQKDEHGTYKAGTMLVSAPGSSHAVSSEEGCVVLAIWARPVEILEG